MAACFLTVLGSGALAQQDWDDLDVIDGPRPTLRYGFYTEPSGQIEMGRYYFLDDGKALRVRLAPFGKTPTELPVRAYDRHEGTLELGWDGRPSRRCRLVSESETLFLGNCIEDETVLPIAIRVADERDVEWQGAHFPVSEVDLAIVAKAREILETQEQRNPSGDRVCDDDIAAGRHSVFCALHSASLEVAGVYRHRRPAIQAVRDSLWQRFPGEYVHLLRDVNNRSDVSDRDLIEAVDSARQALAARLGRSWD